MKTLIKLCVFAAFLGATMSAHAVCKNPDGSLDDPSMGTALVDTGLLPMCEIAAPTPVAQTPVVNTDGMAKQVTSSTANPEIRKSALAGLQR